MGNRFGGSSCNAPSKIWSPPSVTKSRVVGICSCKFQFRNCWVASSGIQNSSDPELHCALFRRTHPRLRTNFFKAFDLQNGVLPVRCQPSKPWPLQVRAIDSAPSVSQSTRHDGNRPAGNKGPEQSKGVDSEESMKFRRRVYGVEDWRKHRSSTRHFRHVLSISSSRVIRSLAFPVLSVTLCAALVAIFNEIAIGNVFPSWVPLLHVPSLPFQLTAPALALLLVFRTNASYARFDEARKAWGQTLNRSRNFVRQALTWIRHPDDSEKLDKLLKLCMAFPISMKHHLTEEPGLGAELKSFLQEDDVERILGSSNRPNYILQTMTEICFTCSLSDMAMAQMDQNLTSLHDNFGTCERILQTPIPLSYTRLTSRFLFIWHATLPLGLWDQCSWVVIPATFISAAALFCIEEIESRFVVTTRHVRVAMTPADQRLDRTGLHLGLVDDAGESFNGGDECLIPNDSEGRFALHPNFPSGGQVGVLVEEPMCMISLDHLCASLRQDTEGLLQAHCDSRELYRNFYRKEDFSIGVSSVNGLSMLSED